MVANADNNMLAAAAGTTARSISMPAGKISRVAVIGCGASGIIAARCLRANGISGVKIFEQSDVVGGTWKFRPESDAQFAMHSSMYEGLHTNLPKQIMQYSDMEIEADIDYPDHTAVQNYLEKYAEKHDVPSLTTFSTKVLQIWKDKAEDGQQWVVRSARIDGSAQTEETFDAVMVCNGHYSQPLIPAIPGIDQLLPEDGAGLCHPPTDRTYDMQKGVVLHSHWYRSPGRFKDRRVLVLGAGSSGQDIAREVGSVAEKVYIASDKVERLEIRDAEEKLVAESIRPVTEFPTVHTAKTRRVVDDKGTEEDAVIEFDDLVICTGYKYAYPFLASEKEGEDHHVEDKDQSTKYYANGEISVLSNGRWVDGLYQHLFSKSDPTLSFVGLPWLCIPFPIAEYQSEWVAQFLAGKLSLPDREAMDAWDKAWRHKMDKADEDARFYHRLGTDQFPYLDGIAEITGLPKTTEDFQWRYFNAKEIRKQVLGY
eukprot:Clim_evm58s214 gene=Clim_evmTU58s214